MITTTSIVDGATVTTTITPHEGAPSTVAVSVATPSTGMSRPALLSILGESVASASLTAAVPMSVTLASYGAMGTYSVTEVSAALARELASVTGQPDEAGILLSNLQGYLATLPGSSRIVQRVVAPTTAGGAGADPLTMAGGNGDVREILVIDNRANPAGMPIQLNSIESAMVVGAASVSGGTGDGYLIGDGSAQMIAGEDGNDTIFGGHGMDDLRGGLGDDYIVGNEAADLLRGGLGNDTLQGGRGADWLMGGDGDDLAMGGRANDVVIGGSGNDTLYGNSGDDILEGGAGSDLFVFDAREDGNDMILDLTRDDQVRIAAAGVPSGMTVEQMLSLHLRADTNGSAVLDFGGGASLTFSGVSVSTLRDELTGVFVIA